jgi:hypothetical protein
MKTLRLGNFEIMPIDREFSTYYDFLLWEETLAGGWRHNNYRLNNYIARSLHQLGVAKFIYDKYSISLVTEIVVVLDTDSSRARDIIIDDPEEVKDFMDGRLATGYDSDGSNYSVNKESAYTLNWEESKTKIILSRKITE